MHALTRENLHNIGAYQIIEILSMLRNAYVIPGNLIKFMFYANNYIDCNHFNKLYIPDWIEKGI